MIKVIEEMKHVKRPIQVTRSSMPDFEEYIEEIRSIWENHWLTNMEKR